jgi:hypothetical protein
MPVLLYHNYEVFIVFNGRYPLLLVDDNRSLGSGELKADMRVVPADIVSKHSKTERNGLPVSTVMTHFELEFIVVKVTRGDWPSGDVWDTITERSEELTEAVPVDCGVVVREIVVHSDPVVLAFGKSE